MLLNTYKHHHIETFFIFTISKRRSIYVVAMSTIFHSHLDFHYDYSFMLIFSNVLLRLDDNVDEESK